MHTEIVVGGVTLPSPTKISTSREQLWSSNTGRSVKTGTMLGAVIAEKRTLDVEWTNITAKQYSDILDALPAGFFGPVKYQAIGDDGKITTITELEKAYRGTISNEDMGYVGKTRYYRSVKTTIIEK